MKVKEVKETLNIDLTEYEHNIIYLSSLMEGLRLAFIGLWEKNYSNGITRNDLHGFSSLLECFQKELKAFDERFYSEVIERIEYEVSEKLTA